MVQSNPKQAFDRAISLLKNDSFDEAEKICRSSLSENDRDINFLFLLGTIQMRKNELEEAIKIFKADGAASIWSLFSPQHFRQEEMASDCRFPQFPEKN